MHFIGPRAIKAFDDAGGVNYKGRKVPIENDSGHWRGTVFLYELMIGGIVGLPTQAPLSAITIEAFADLGYQVDVSQADPYCLPRPFPSPKPVADHGLELKNCVQNGPIRVVDENGRVVRIIGE